MRSAKVRRDRPPLDLGAAVIDVCPATTSSSCETRRNEFCVTWATIENASAVTADRRCSKAAIAPPSLIRSAGGSRHSRRTGWYGGVTVRLQGGLVESAGWGGPPPSDRRGSAIDVVVHAPIRLHRDGVVALLARCPEVRVVDATGSGEAARATVGRARPAVVVVDAAPAIDVELLHDLASRVPTPRVVVLGMPEEDELVLACAAAGVIGYLACGRHGG